VKAIRDKAEAVRVYAKQAGDFELQNRKRTSPVSYRNFLKRHLTPSMKKLGIKEPGKAAHAFRRF
jgi:hypothetical protein